MQAQEPAHVAEVFRHRNQARVVWLISPGVCVVIKGDQLSIRTELGQYRAAMSASAKRGHLHTHRRFYRQRIYRFV
jgi:hypothetical protein